MADRLKTGALFAAIAGLWCLVPQTGLADSVTEVPEPTSLSLLAGAVATTLYMIRRRGK